MLGVGLHHLGEVLDREVVLLEHEEAAPDLVEGLGDVFGVVVGLDDALEAREGLLVLLRAEEAHGVVVALGRVGEPVPGRLPGRRAPSARGAARASALVARCARRGAVATAVEPWRVSPRP